MSVRAKFRCDSIEHTADGATVKMAPVISGSEENKTFYRYTPGGSISLAVVNKDTAARFEPGKSYYVDFTPAAD